MIKKLGLQGKKYYTKGAFDIYEELYDLKDRSILFDLSLRFRDVKKILNKYVRQNKHTLNKLQTRYNEMTRLYS